MTNDEIIKVVQDNSDGKTTEIREKIDGSWLELHHAPRWNFEKNNYRTKGVKTTLKNMITEEDLMAVLTKAGQLNNFSFTAIMDAAFPFVFKPKKGEIIWGSIMGKTYTPVLFSYMDNGEYVCFENDTDDEPFIYQYAKPQTPKQKGE
jgi:hypothetical protein